MCVNLCKINPADSTQANSQALPQAVPQTDLSGTVVSSLHRLKDTDNSDGGFFVFGDLSVKVEGEYQLRFRLFEMIKYLTLPSLTTWLLMRWFRTQVVFIKDVVSKNFTAASKQEEFGPMFDETPASLQPNVSGLSQRAPLEHPYTPQYSGMNEHATKRQRTSVDMGDRGAMYNPRSYPQFNTYATRDQASFNFTTGYNESTRAPQNTDQDAFQFTAGLGYHESARPSHNTMPDFSFGQRRTDSSSTSSDFVSPLAEVHGQSNGALNGPSWPSTSMAHLPPMRDLSSTYPGSFFDLPPRLAEPPPQPNGYSQGVNRASE
ncbi:MAG: hypothetical protein Q9220_004746 [cf. Caloplaca sp. 1 TL-2023]